MTLHQPQIGPPPPGWNDPQLALPASGVDVAALGVPGSEMSALVEATDWSAGPLGDPQHWPQSLRTAVGICLSSRFPILLWWGPDLVDDLQRRLPPDPGPEQAPACPRCARSRGLDRDLGRHRADARAGDGRGGATWSADQLLVLDRNGYPEECYFTFSYSPITDESGGVGGVFCAVTETTERVVGERRLATLAEMAALMGAPSRADVVRTAASIMRANTADHPVVVVLDAPPEGDRGALVELVEQQLPALPAGARARVADLVRQVSGTGNATTVPADGEAAAAGIQGWHAYPVAVSAGPARGRGAAVIVLGESVHRAWDRSLEAYATLCATHVAAALSDVRQLSEERRRRQALVELDAAKSAFFTNLSHELRTPLTLISRPGAGGARCRGRPRPARSDSSSSSAAPTALARMVDAMLDFGRIEAGGLAPRPEPLDVTEPRQGSGRELPAGGGAGRARLQPRLRRRHRGAARPRHGRADRAQPAVQRGEVHARGVGRAHRAAGRRRRRDRGERHRRRHPPGRRRPRLRPLRAAPGPGRCPLARGCRHRSGDGAAAHRADGRQGRP